MIVGHLWVGRGLFVELCFHNLSYPPQLRFISPPQPDLMSPSSLASPPLQRGLANRTSLPALPLDRTPDCIYIDRFWCGLAQLRTRRGMFDRKLNKLWSFSITMLLTASLPAGCSRDPQVRKEK